MSSIFDSVVAEETVIAYDENGDQIFTHYAHKDKVTEGYVMGTPVEALCGKVFVPFRNPDKYPLCPMCKDLLESLFRPSE
jgi:hypothetical protein